MDDEILPPIEDGGASETPSYTKLPRVEYRDADETYLGMLEFSSIGEFGIYAKKGFNVYSANDVDDFEYIALGITPGGFTPGYFNYNFYGKMTVEDGIDSGRQIRVPVLTADQSISFGESGFDYSVGTNEIELTDAQNRQYFRYGSDGAGTFVQSAAINTRTTSSNPNVTLTSDNTLRKSTSAKKYKEDIQKIKLDPKLILKVDPVSWIDKAELEEGNIQRRYFGLIADYVEAVGLGDYVTYRDGEVDGLMYDRLLTLLIPIVKEHEEQMDNINKIASLALTKVKELEKQIEGLTK